MARLLNTYQLWLDELYPRAKFEDGLVIIEQLGHTKRMQIMRREWINGEKPRESLGSLEEGAAKPAGQQNLREDRSWDLKSGQELRAPIPPAGVDNDVYAATQKSSHDGMAKSDGDKEIISSEDITGTYPIVGQKYGSSAREADFNDDEEALLALNEDTI